MSDKLRLKVSRKETNEGGVERDPVGKLARARARVAHEAAHEEEVCLA